MAQKKPYRRPLSLIRLNFCWSDRVEFSGRKLIIFVLLQLLLSPFILITGDNINEGVHNAIHLPLVYNTIPNSHVDNNPAMNDISDQFNENKSKLHATNRKFNDGNSISIENENGTVEGETFDGNLSSIENASMLDQSRPDCNTKRCAREWRTHNNIFNNDTNDMANNNERILSRKRRYLVFEPGSSVQIVFDTYQPILGYSNYLVLGITAAMAWELPSEPVYLDEELQESYQMGKLPLLNRNDQNISDLKHTDSNSVNNNINNNYHYKNLLQQKFPSKSSNQQYSTRPIYNKGYYDSVKDNQVDPSNKIQNYLMYANKLVKDFKEITDKIPKNRPLGTQDFQNLADFLAKNVKSSKGAKVDTMPKRKSYRHFIHPLFKKRSIENLSPLEKFDINLHRKSRHTLFRQIDTFMKARGNNGNQCILKLLCETGQQDGDERPGSMVTELLRAIFTLPKPLDASEHPIHRQYDEAHASTDNCAKMFPLCRESLLNSKFM